MAMGRRQVGGMIDLQILPASTREDFLDRCNGDAELRCEAPAFSPAHGDDLSDLSVREGYPWVTTLPAHVAIVGAGVTEKDVIGIGAEADIALVTGLEPFRDLADEEHVGRAMRDLEPSVQEEPAVPGADG